MDCEAFEAAMMDDLYGELDELTAAAMKRHASGCARCATMLDGLRATRRVAAVPIVDVPSGLTERILAVAETQTVVPFRRRAARAISVAGTWAMRPQSAMAAVFMVMLGSSLLLLRGRSSRAPAESEVTVTEHGTPAPAGPSPGQQLATPEPPFVPLGQALPAASAAPAGRAAEAKVAAAAPALAPAGANAPGADSPLDDMRSAKARVARDEEGAGLAAGGGGGFAAPPPAAAPMAPAAPMPVAAQAYASRGAAAEPASSSFDAAVRLYESGRFDEATRAFEALAPQDVNADLYAARSIREGRGCSSAVARFDRVAHRANGSPPGWDALLEGAICYRSIGDFGSARVRLTPLLSVDSHRDRARAEIDRLGDVQAQGGSVAAPAKAGRARATPPAAAGAAPTSPPADVGGQ
jgi:hypothetical protein